MSSGADEAYLGAPVLAGIGLPFLAVYLVDRRGNWWALISSDTIQPGMERWIAAILYLGIGATFGALWLRQRKAATGWRDCSLHRPCNTPLDNLLKYKYNYTYIRESIGLEVNVPNKTIYVADDDLPLFERAQELSGTNLSSVIVRALRRFIEIEEARRSGLDEITVIVNGEGGHRSKRFIGQRLVRWLQKTRNGKGTEILSVYRTARNQFALHTRSIPSWELSWGDPEYVGDPKNWGVGNGMLQRVMSWGFDWKTFKESGDYSLQVFESLEKLKAVVSDDLYRAVSQALEGPEIEDLNI